MLARCDDRGRTPRLALGVDVEVAFLQCGKSLKRSALWEPTILMLREKPKGQAERGFDFFVKYQHNRIAESMRTVGQWPLYEPVLRALPGQQVAPARRWSMPPDVE